MESLNDEEKTLIHISHLHPLKLYHCREANPICHACHGLCVDECYGCNECFYYLHTTCASFQKALDHPSHPAHTLNLRLTPCYRTGGFGCNACGGEGYSFCFHCKECQFDLHLSCASLREKLTHPTHPHALELVYENPYPNAAIASCDFCEKSLDLKKWFYLCRECGYGGHVECFTNTEEVVEVLRRGEEQAAQNEASSVPDQIIQLLQTQQELNANMMAMNMNANLSAFGVQQQMNTHMMGLKMRADLTKNMCEAIKRAI